MKIAIVQLSGGLGNQLFQYTFGQYLFKNGFKVYYDKYSGFRGTKNKNQLVKFNFDIQYSNSLISMIFFFLYKLSIKPFYFKEKESFYFDKSIKDYKRMITFFIGCWQNLKYVEYFKNDLKNKIFTNNNFLRDLSRKFVLNSNSIGIHVRRGDYVNNLIHETIGVKYFLDTIEYLNNEVNFPCFFIISDDINWCKENLIFENCTYIDFTKNEFEDFEILKNCHHKIISNSSFSWWAAFLGEENSSITICPKKWTNKIERNSLQLPNWKLI